jgi:hypothetical protein
MDSAAMADFIRGTQRSVCYAAPGIQVAPGSAMIEVAQRFGPELISVCLDFDERVMRMGFGDLAAVKALRAAGISVRSTPGLRTGLIIVDDEGYIFTPTALYLEPDQRSSEAPNALRLSLDQVTEARARLSPAAKAIAIILARSTEERDRIKDQAIEVPSVEVDEAQFGIVEQSLKEAPPVSFDVARQVRVFEPYLQYVELRLTGAAIHRFRVAIPKNIQNLGTDKGIESRLKTTFDLIERESALSSKPIEDDLNEVRRNLTPSLGKDHGRVLLKAKKDLFESRIADLRSKLDKFQSQVRELQGHLDASREEIINYYLPRLMDSPPDSLAGQLLTDKPTENEARKWLNDQLDDVFPTAEHLIKKMELDLTYKDVTFETLNRDDFLPLLKEAFPYANWEKAYAEFRAASEKTSGGDEEDEEAA